MLQCPKTKKKGLSTTPIWFVFDRSRAIATAFVHLAHPLDQDGRCCCATTAAWMPRRPRVHVLDAMRQVASALPGSTRDCSASLPLCQSLQMADVWREERVQMKLSDADACCRRRAFTRTQITRICIFTREGVDFSQKIRS